MIYKELNKFLLFIYIYLISLHVDVSCFSSDIQSVLIMESFEACAQCMMLPLMSPPKPTPHTHG